MVGEMNELALFAGAGGGILGGKLLGWRTVCAVEWEPYPASVLCARQNDGLLPPFPIWDDVQTFDGKPWRGIVDVVSGGFPCQDISAAGKGAGIDGERSGMWGEMARIIREVRPRFVFVENSPMLTSRGLGRVLGDLASMGFDAKWGVLGAADVGANHQRDRIWIVAKWHGQLPHAQHNRIRWWEQQQKSIKKTSEELANAKRIGWNERNNAKLETNQTIGSTSTISIKSSLERYNWNNWSAEPDVCRVVNGVADTMDRLKAIGNGQVPLCAATAWRILTER
jgi:DNA (cytosine-5)-methyltransferase 1